MKKAIAIIAAALCVLMAYALFLFPYSVSKTYSGLVLPPKKTSDGTIAHVNIHIKGYHKGITPITRSFTGEISITVADTPVVSECRSDLFMRKSETGFDESLWLLHHCIYLDEQEWELGTLYIDYNFESVLLLARKNDGSSSWTSEDCLRIVAPAKDLREAEALIEERMLPGFE